MNICVTGGYGYVGSIVCEKLIEKGHYVVIVDNLSQGIKDAVHGVEFCLADIRDIDTMSDIFQQYKFDAVIHLAGETVVEKSIKDPRAYFSTNVIGSTLLLDVMKAHDCKRIIYSSSASVYGEPSKVPINEKDDKKPINSYGESKLMFEKILKWYSRAYGIQYTTFRYFNVAGATTKCGENHNPETHLIPCVLKAAKNNSVINIFGDDYETKDGSCIRDYVHVEDVAKAHLLALDINVNGVYNLGSGFGYSNLEVLMTANIITGKEIKYKVIERRAGDPSILITDNTKAKIELGWRPTHSLQSMIQSAWEYMNK